MASVYNSIADAAADAVQATDAAQDKLNKLIIKREDAITRAEDRAVLAILDAEEAMEVWTLAFTVFGEANAVAEDKAAFIKSANLPLAAAAVAGVAIEKAKAAAKVANTAKRAAEKAAKKEDVAAAKVAEVGEVYAVRIADAVVLIVRSWTD